MRRSRARQKGMALAFVLVAIVILSVIGFALGSRGIQNMDLSFRALQEAQAYYAAQAGVARALYAIQENDPSLPACGKTGTPSFSPTQILNDNARFNVKVTNNFGGCGSGDIAAPDGTQVPTGVVYVSSTGVMLGSTKSARQMFQVAEGWNYPYAAFGKNGVTLTGNAYTNSYNSNNGPYGGMNISKNGNVGTDSNANGAITLTGNAQVYGNAAVGPGGTAGSPTISKSGNAGYASASALSSPLALPPNTDPLGGYGSTNVSSGVIFPGKYGNISVSGNNTVTLSCGTYSVYGINVSGNGKIIVNCPASDPVKIYVYNTLNLSGNGIDNTGQNPTGMFIYGMPGLTSATVTGNGLAAYALYAPSANISTTGNGDIYGSVIGLTVTDTGNANIHYDQALSTDQSAGGITVTPEGWFSQ